MTRPEQTIQSVDRWQMMSPAAWAVRENAHLIGNTAVGCIALAANGEMFAGCNVEHRHRCHDVHAEINAITSMLAAGEKDLVAILIVTDRERFTPCGGCLDWIFQFGGRECKVGYQNDPDGPMSHWTAEELMPHYPI